MTSEVKPGGMYPGISARLERIGRDGNYVIIPMDHGITLGPVQGLEDLEATVDAVTSGGADAVLTQRGVAPRIHPHRNGAGYVVHLNASTALGPDQNEKRQTSTVKAAVQAGADAVSIHINVGSAHEPAQLEALADVTERAGELGIPVLAMAYARGTHLTGTDPEHNPEYLAHAVRLAEELGADLVKTAYSGTRDSFSRVVDGTRLPVLIAGGEPTDDRETLETVAGAMDAGAAGVSIGRTVFQHDDPQAITRAIVSIVHDGATPEAALTEAGLRAD